MFGSIIIWTSFYAPIVSVPPPISDAPIVSDPPSISDAPIVSDAISITQNPPIISAKMHSGETS